MKRRHEQRWECSICNCFHSLLLRTLLSHYNKVHANEPNFRVVCNVDDCPAIFSKYNSLYKHVKRHHGDIYNVTVGEDLDAEFRNTITDDTGINNGGLNVIDQDSDNGINGGNTSTSSDEFEMIQDQNTEIDVKKSAASFLMKVKERNKIPQVAMELIIDSTRTLIKQVVDSVKTDVLDIIDSNEDKKQVNEVFESVKDPFVGIETDALQSSYIKQNFNYVEPKQVILGKKLLRKKSNRVIYEKDEKFVYIPILESLKQILTNSRMSKMVLRKPKCCDKDVFYDVQDGSIYQDDKYFEEHENTLCIVLYHDELEVCNPLGSNAGVHKLDMYYFTIANLCPKFRSKRCAIHLFAIANADLVKKYSIDTIMQPLLDDLNVLYRGCNMIVDGVEKIIHGKVLMCTGDTLGQHYWGGYKEGVGAAFQKCRNCQCTFEQMQADFLEEAFTLRTKETYSAQCDAIEQAPTLSVQKDMETTYGLTRRSLLCKLPTFDVTCQLPQDIMHTLLEGVVQYEVRLVLLHYINSNLTSLSQINGAILSHEYGYSEVSDKPGPLKDAVFNGDEKYKLKYNAAQARLFVRLLPFILCPLVNTNDEYYLFILQLIQIVQLIFSPVIKLETINQLTVLIQQHLSKFKELFPSCNILPKQHYLLHIPSTIRMLGPMIRSSCFSFESAHNYFKELARKQNFKNLPLSLAKRHQFNLCCNFGDPSEDPSSHPLFSGEKVYGVLKKLDEEMCVTLRQRFNLQGLLPGINFINAYKVSWIKLFGTKYAKSGVIAVDVTKNPVHPVFGVIVCIWSIHNFIYFDVQLLRTVCFDYKHQAYHVTSVENKEDEKAVCSYNSLLDFNVFHCKKGHLGQQYVPVKYDLGDIIKEHAEGRNPLH